LAYRRAGADTTVPGGGASGNESIGVEYFPATYYNKTTSSLAYSVNGSSGNCANPNAAHYALFQQSPSTLTAIDALGPDGSCLTKVVIDPAITSYTNDGSRSECPNTCTYANEIQNFANWFSYYKKRHLALRAGMAQAFTGVQSINTGLFTINSRNDVSMRDLDITADKSSLFNSLYRIDGNGGGTPNRAALKHAAGQYARTNTGAPITAECQKNFTLLFTDGF
jgi:type IV pilus assembly protein PilY1